MRSITVAFLLAGNAFATPLDGEKLERLLGLEYSREVRRDTEAVPSPLPWRLLGTLRSREGLSFAAVECGTRSVTLQVGDVRDGVEVVAIEQQLLIVARLGRLERIGPGSVGLRFLRRDPSHARSSSACWPTRRNSCSKRNCCPRWSAES